MFTPEQLRFMNKGFEIMKEANQFFQYFDCRRLVYPSELTEMIAGKIYESITGHDIIFKGKSCKGDLYDTTANEHIEVKSSILVDKNDLTSFGAGEEFNRILFLEINESEGVATLYNISLSNIDIMDVIVDTKGHTYADKCAKNDKNGRPRPHFSIKKWIIEKKGILPVTTVYFKEGHWQI